MICNCNPILLLLLLDLIDIRRPSQEIKLHLEFEAEEIQHCSFNLKGDLIFSCETSDFFSNFIDIVCVYSIQTKTNETKCQKMFKIPEGVKVINISKYNKILLRSNDNIYEWDVCTGHTTMITKNIYEVINMIVNVLFIRK